MTREDLLKINYGVIKELAKNVMRHSPRSIIIIITNPVDIMTYYFFALVVIRLACFCGL
jgi:malate dehydrogenase